VDVQFGSLSVLSSDAFVAFLPAWLLRSLNSLDTDQQKIREWTLYALAFSHDDEFDDDNELPGKTNRLRRRYETPTPEQVGSIEHFLLLIRDHARLSEWDRKSINRTLPLLRQP
jgi:hypothetical protein